MEVWLDEQLPPKLIRWLSETFAVETRHVWLLGLPLHTDKEIFDSAGRAGAVVMTKDRDLVDLVETFGPPPQIIWLTCGNTSNARLQTILESK